MFLTSMLISDYEDLLLLVLSNNWWDFCYPMQV